MKEHTKNPDNISRTLNSNPRASSQATISQILQTYKEQTFARQPIQHVKEEDEELLQGKFEPEQREKPNNTGLPDSLKTGIENFSGYSMDDVKVHYNSDKPAQFEALAYTQGTDIHIASGEEKYLSHEAWHVIQQKQGRVQPTGQLKGTNVNEDVTLEKEADLMGKESEGLDSDLIIQKQPQTCINVIQRQPPKPSKDHAFIKEFKGGNINGIKVSFSTEETLTHYEIKCEIGSKDLFIKRLLRYMTLLQRHFYNKYLENPFTNEDVLIVHYTGVNPNFTYSQEVTYSNKAAGYVTREEVKNLPTQTKDKTFLTEIKSRSEYTGKPKTQKLNTYENYHSTTKTTPWINILTSDKTTGDNGSKLTAERARFEPLMNYSLNKLNDKTSFEIAGKNVTALNMTNNTNAIYKVRQYKRLINNAIEVVRGLRNKKTKNLLLDILKDESKNFSVRLKDCKEKSDELFAQSSIIGDPLPDNLKLIVKDDDYDSSDKKLPFTVEDIEVAIKEDIWQ